MLAQSGLLLGVATKMVTPKLNGHKVRTVDLRSNVGKFRSEPNSDVAGLSRAGPFRVQFLTWRKPNQKSAKLGKLDRVDGA